jgi:hypothetical protein
MVLLLLIYIIGAIVAPYLLLSACIRQSKEISLADLSAAIAITFFSWLGVGVILSVFYEDIIIYRRKK